MPPLNRRKLTDLPDTLNQLFKFRMSVVYADIVSLVKNFTALCTSLPSSLPVANKEDNIYTTLLCVNEGDTYMTFNRIFDILYKEDSDCCLHYILCGKYGMDKICVYLNGVDWSEPNIPLDLMKLKLDQVINELTFLMCIQNKLCESLKYTSQNICEGRCQGQGRKVHLHYQKFQVKNQPTKEKGKKKGKKREGPTDRVFSKGKNEWISNVLQNLTAF